MNFIEEEVIKRGNLNSLKFRFPPEPNGMGIHIGHAKSVCLNFGLAEKFNSPCILRFDDTNPSAEKREYVDAMIDDIKWLGFNPSDINFTSDYFDKLYDFAVKLIKKGKAYVCDLTFDEISENRKTPTEPGVESPYRDRSVEENLNLFNKMRSGDFEDGSKTLRAKIDMSSSNMHMRDPIIYRIKSDSHYRSGEKWCIYPTYDFAHCLSDAIEGITNSICTLEFEVHRPLYEWIVNELIDGDKPSQIEFARLNLTYTVMSKRKLKELVDGGYVDGWNDPRMPTIAGLRRRGYTPNSIKMFCDKIGVARRENLIDVSLLESCVREDLNKTSNRVMAVLDPLKVTITNYPEGKIEYLDAINNPEDGEAGKRKIPFSRNLWIERSDFMENAPRKFFRLTEGKEVRFKYAYYITCNEVIKDEDGNVIELKCTYDPETKGGWVEGRKVKGTIHWVCADSCDDMEVRLYDRLFKSEEVSDDFISDLNENSLTIVNGKIEPDFNIKDTVQFERTGYFILDKNSDNELIFNRTVPLRDSWKNKK